MRRRKKNTLGTTNNFTTLRQLTFKNNVKITCRINPESNVEKKKNI